MKKCVGSILWLFSPFVFAFSLEADIYGGNLQWRTALESGNGLVPSFWQPTSNLAPTTSWTPGAFVGALPSYVTVSSGSSSVDVPVDFVGVEYHVGGAGSIAAPSPGGACEGNYSSPVAIAKGRACFTSYQLNTERSVTPFAFFRPIIDVANSNVLKAFDGKPEGVYRGTASFTFSYLFDVGGVTSKRDLTSSVSFVFNYVPSFISSVSIDGLGIIEANYDFHADRVWGATEYDVKAKGWFTEGVRVSLNHARDRNYELLGPSRVPLPYSIYCVGCVDNELVKDGRVSKYSTVVRGSDTDLVSFKVHASYDTTHSELEIGEYSDYFVLIFEPEL
ncbi:hypothetical protein F9L16_17640 [Agarivorans sp. B2Z047]|uniref:hypothetical protein n=1 Tax=Agarivorans sp. B2Z047 TaxID=2652721 RepID=UPI00128E79A7|nr:hypothetical protein [Agarivorans sp. B2Z047]MPW30812.1 hypothetical protein [Agarivorans sp. B2Z047]UQN40958.1 hypothetical protein LQZ07_14370 [Agarivorans sp. B2Z047]